MVVGPVRGTNHDRDKKDAIMIAIKPATQKTDDDLLAPARVFKELEYLVYLLGRPTNAEWLDIFVRRGTLKPPTKSDNGMVRFRRGDLLDAEFAIIGLKRKKNVGVEL